jgi:hypothetical protein
MYATVMDEIAEEIDITKLGIPTNNKIKQDAYSTRMT